MSLYYADVEAVITSYDQGSMILETIQSVCEQTVCPKKIIVVDDGSTDPQSLEVLREIEQTRRFAIPVEVHRQENRGVSAARNAGLRKVGASSWMRTFGVLDAVVCPMGGDIVPFLSRNCCPATHILRMDRYWKSGGYDETMRSGFEDWEFFLRLLETAWPDAVSHRAASAQLFGTSGRCASGIGVDLRHAPDGKKKSAAPSGMDRR